MDLLETLAVCARSPSLALFEQTPVVMLIVSSETPENCASFGRLYIIVHFDPGPPFSPDAAALTTRVPRTACLPQASRECWEGDPLFCDDGTCSSLGRLWPLTPFVPLDQCRESEDGPRAFGRLSRAYKYTPARCASPRALRCHFSPHACALLAPKSYIPYHSTTPELPLLRQP